MDYCGLMLQFLPHPSTTDFSKSRSTFWFWKINCGVWLDFPICLCSDHQPITDNWYRLIMIGGWSIGASLSQTTADFTRSVQCLNIFCQTLSIFFDLCCLLTKLISPRCILSRWTVSKKKQKTTYYFQLRGLVKQTPGDSEPWFRFLLCCNLLDSEPSGLFLALPFQEPLLWFRSRFPPVSAPLLLNCVL